MRRLLALAAAAAFAGMLALVVGCGAADEPSSLVDDPGYHVRDGTVFYLNAFPGKAFRIDGADAPSFEALDRTYARDIENVYINGHELLGAHAESFRLMDRPGFAKDRGRVYRHDQAISTDPGHFELLAGDLARDRAHVYWTDGTVLSDDPQNFTIVADRDDFLFAKDGGAVFVNGNVIAGADPSTFEVLQGAYSRDGRQVFYFDTQVTGADVTTFRPLDGPYGADRTRVYWMGRPIEGADPESFGVLNANFECSADRSAAFYRDMVIADADPATFPPGRPVTGCSESTISFAD